MVTKLGKWTLNTRKWREENGLTTPEWEMYVINRKMTAVLVGTLNFVLGVISTLYFLSIVAIS